MAAKATTPAAQRGATTKAATARSRSRGTKASTAAQAAAMAVRDDEEPWTEAELTELRAEVESDIAQLEREIATAEAELHDLMLDAGDGAGDDQADAGAKTFEREQEISLANNARDLLDQNRRALQRMADGTYGLCESCGNPIGKLRLQAAPRATLCMPCKKKEERR
ncbi:TraR/DksA family transcriptional regulator [Nostocoides sp. F2B08]|uniref:TraR/DksA family transcriptional regulator n=1 Tax=Nostocoides sp. F2B08 TaxID=2653936 RepID=UPI0012634129|nr:TraR/DksA C4-type zinc finger protein [Tetrasphaera sp. F2B08]KAB7741063.1 TraR/DksA family transcriptional regulator [Tetrasphaera sp. F2B08]